MKNFSGHTFCFLGRSGSGKDSQTNFLIDFLKKQEYNVLSISTSNEARNIIRKQTAVGNWLKTILDSGDFFPDWVAISLWMCVFQDSVMGDDIVIFSGSPRKPEEARVLDDLMRGTHRVLPTPIYLDISEEEARRRLLKRGRSDDNIEAINERLSWFKKQVLPIIDYYDKRAIVIDGNGPVSDVSKRMMRKLSGL